ncbi:Hypothetical predicted protein [Olea europaea subsp. europaea]|uniref:Uncharacterized protein n=1 Tax=Olea europaea subsp. europaea TaxID=158383 RepID=A0A8S0QY37_OLEEU|nr:Hypothetical predicted protein [Olea europaea subsp. europaea]
MSGPVVEEIKAKEKFQDELVIKDVKEDEDYEEDTEDFDEEDDDKEDGSPSPYS